MGRNGYKIQSMEKRENSLGRTQEIQPPQSPLQSWRDIFVGVVAGAIFGVGIPQNAGALGAGVGMESFHQSREFANRVRGVADFVSPYTEVLGVAIGFMNRHAIRSILSRGLRSWIH